MTRIEEDRTPVTKFSGAPSGGVSGIRAQNAQAMQNIIDEAERSFGLAETCMRELEQLRAENLCLRNQLKSNGLVPESGESDIKEIESPILQLNSRYTDVHAASSSKGGLLTAISTTAPPRDVINRLPGEVPEDKFSLIDPKPLPGVLAQPEADPNGFAPVLPVDMDSIPHTNSLPKNMESEPSIATSGHARRDESVATDVDQERKAAAHTVFADASAMKEKLRMNLAKPQYDVRNFYKTTGWAQRIARHALFENLTLGVIAFNAGWIAVDTDHNGADMLIEAHPVFQVMENFFCLYFSFEWTTRFLAFKRKRDSIRDAWFVFDSTLVFMMVGETWLMSVFVLIMGGSSSSAMGNASILRLFRLLRLSRMARMVRLLRAMPELMVLIKGMVVAMRSVFFTLCLLGGIIYLFGIAFVQLTKGSAAGDEFFPSVPAAMNSLLLQGVLPDQAGIIDGVGDEGWAFKIIILIYILLASLTVMNMLVGVLCEVVSVVSAVEKESLLVNYVKSTLQRMLETSGIDADGDHCINRDEFEKMLDLPGAAKTLQEVGVDVVGLVDFTDFIFKDGKELSFPDFMDMVLQLRGTNNATVKDIVDLRKSLMLEIAKNTNRTKDVVDALHSSRQLEDHRNKHGKVNHHHHHIEVAVQQDNMSWAATTAKRLAEAANQLTAAAGELQDRHKTYK